MSKALLTVETPSPAGIVAALADGGVRYVVGMPGGLTGPIWRALHNHPTIRAVQCREESIGSYMAEAFGRATGEPIVVMGQGEWIVGNAGQGYLEALLGSSPVVILTEMSDYGDAPHHAPYQCGTGDYGTWDARTALTGVCKRVMVSQSPVQAVQHTQLAIKHALTGDPGPVAVVFAQRALQGNVGPDSSPRLWSTVHYLGGRAAAVDERVLGHAAEQIRAAERPVILAGNGVRLSRARAELARLAEALDAPVVTTSGGKGVFGETDPRSAGVVGRMGRPAANRVLASADLVIAVGTKLGPHDTSGLVDPARQTFVQIDAEPLNVSWTLPIDLQLIGDAKVQMQALSAAVAAAGPISRELTGIQRVLDAVEAGAAVPEPPLADDAGCLDPRVTIAALADALPENAAISCDAGENRLFMLRWFPATSTGEYLQPAAGGGMGYAVPAAMGAKLADPGRLSVAVCGDGGFAMSIHALMTAVQEKLPIGVIILNNGALGWVLHSMGNEAVAASFASFDHAAIAQAVGCEGVHVTTVEELRDALKRLEDLTVPLIIDVATTLNISFKDIEQDL